MKENYIEYTFTIEPLQPGSEILIAELGLAGFESFIETPEGVKAYIQKEAWNNTILEEIYILQNPEFAIFYEIKEIEQVNWNAAWEKNFSPIQVGDICTVRAPFHKATQATYEIIIEPKMSFGTGHHETTFMMLEYILEEDFKDKKVLDMGCGTAVLAILTEKLGATSIDAIDIDAWCFENAVENCERNTCNNIQVQQGDAHLLKGKQYDTILANINRNILLQDIGVYATSLSKDGTLLLSGFYLEDLPLIKEVCNKEGLSFISHKEKNKWVAAKFLRD
jgi:ribosomal protein L11 methyltransferase